MPWLGPLALGLLAVYPLAALGLLGPQGALKWVDTYGVQILLYVLLGWGLNITVGLAGLLDLGYAAFYAVGAYAYALLAPATGFGFWRCCRSAACSRPSGAFASAFPSCGCAATISPSSRSPSPKSCASCWSTGTWSPMARPGCSAFPA